MTEDELRRLRARVAGLEQENADLRERLAYAWQEVEWIRRRLLEVKPPLRTGNLGSGPPEFSWRSRLPSLEKLIATSAILPARRLPDDGLKARALVQEPGYEGLVAKDPRAPYRPARRAGAR